MNNQQRGSEKLFAGCTELQTLSQDELERVAGAGLLSSPMGVMGTVGFVGWPLSSFGVSELHARFQSEIAAIRQVDGAAAAY